MNRKYAPQGATFVRFNMDYATLMNKSDFYCSKAIDMYKKGEMELAKFFKNASIGFKMRALDLLIGGAYVLDCLVRE